MKADKDFQQQARQEFAEADFIGKRIFVRLIAVFLVIGIIGGGWYGVSRYMKTNADRVIFKQSVTYNEGASSFLAKSYREYNAAETAEEKKAIMQYVEQRYPNIDTGKIENDELRRFYNDCIGG